MKKKYGVAAVTGLARKTDLTGVKFKCQKCGAVFFCAKGGQEAWDRLLDRVYKHWGPEHSEVLAINPPVGMAYMGYDDHPYKGGDVDEWHKEMRRARNLGLHSGEPLFKTVKV